MGGTNWAEVTAVTAVLALLAAGLRVLWTFILSVRDNTKALATLTTQLERFSETIGGRVSRLEAKVFCRR